MCVYVCLWVGGWGILGCGRGPWPCLRAVFGGGICCAAIPRVTPHWTASIVCVSQDPLVTVYITNATMVDGNSSAFTCLNATSMSTGQLMQYTNTIMPPNCGQHLLST